jgi:inosine/xanthosine triphosphate pyrophosphatase family protein
MKDVIIATENAGKLDEIKSLLGNTFERYYCLKDLPDKVIVDEDQPSYVANALKKPVRLVTDTALLPSRTIRVLK